MAQQTTLSLNGTSGQVYAAFVAKTAAVAVPPTYKEIIDAIDSHIKSNLDDGGAQDYMIAGKRITKYRLEELLEDLRRHAAWGVLGAPPVPVLHADAEVELEDLTLATWNFVSSMEPFGEANREPVLITYGAVPLDVRRVVADGKRLKRSFDADGRRIESIGFGLGDRKLGRGPVDIVYQLRSEVWQGRTRYQLGLRDIRQARG